MMNISKMLIVLFALLMSFSEKLKAAVLIEPVVGYERVQKVLPTPHTKDRLMYGLRVLMGVPLLSLELVVLMP